MPHETPGEVGAASIDSHEIGSLLAQGLPEYFDLIRQVRHDEHARERRGGESTFKPIRPRLQRRLPLGNCFSQARQLRVGKAHEQRAVCFFRFGTHAFFHESAQSNALVLGWTMTSTESPISNPRVAGKS